MPGHFATQNLNERHRPGSGPHDGEVAGPIWRYGRCWLTHYAAPEAEASGPRLHVAWQIPSRHVGWQVTVHNTDEDDLSVHVGCGLVALWAGIGGVFPARWRYRTDKSGQYREAHQTGLHVFSGAVWWDIWHTSGSWSTRTPRWQTGSWHPLDTLLGRTRYSTVPLGTYRAAIPLPEGSVPATFVFERATWRRPRWPRWPLLRTRAYVDVEPDRPLPVPGKGDSAWDCGDDALYRMSFPAQSVEEAIGHVVQEVLRERLRHGGSFDWQPAVSSGEAPAAAP